jgi:cell division septation protein DedD
MREDFDEEEFEPEQPSRDTEVTLSTATLLVAFFGLVLICGLCFGLGYAVGHRSSQDASASAPPAAASTELTADGSRPKPSATTQTAATPQSAETDQTAGTTPDADQAAGQAAQPAPSGTVMVQIAAVSHQEDAGVLVGALRKRGYAVTVSQDAADGQFHVRVGPFASRNDANAMRQKLLKDGYDAVVQ